MHQRIYVVSLPQPPTERTADAFATVRFRLEYASTSTRPNCTATVNMISQVLAHKATAKKSKDLDASLARMTSTELCPNFPCLNIDFLEIRVYADSSIENNADKSSQLGYVVFVVDKDDNCALLAWCWKKSRRITRSVLSAELFALSAG